jgi:hypothetical protein
MRLGLRFCLRDAVMKTEMIEPDELEADAVVPQCLDNQYVSDKIFKDMLDRGVDFLDEAVAAGRESDFKTEFVRSILYSSQIVVQRAYLNNSHFLYKNYLPTDAKSRKDLVAFAALVRGKAIVPFLFNESSLTDQLEFDLSKDAHRATRALLEEVGDEITCLRLSKDDAVNRRATSFMEAKFGEMLSRLAHVNGDMRNAMASELFAPDSRARLDEPGAWEAFNKSLNDLAFYAFKMPQELAARGENRGFSRSHVYRDHFVAQGEDAVIHGRFKPPDLNNPFLLELKKYVDLAYNTNLPDHLKRYTFTPANLPSRMALQDNPGIGYSGDQVYKILTDNETLESVRRIFMAHVQKAMDLPLLKDLSVADVHELRSLPEWHAFKDAQTAILKNPLECLDRLGPFQTRFDSFQHALSGWHNKKYERKRTEAKYASYVSLAVSAGGKLIVAGADLPPLERAAATVLSDFVTKNIPEKVTNLAVKLLVGVYDMGERRLDAERSYSVELMQTNSEFAREDIVDLLNAIKGRGDMALRGGSSQVADQGVR